MAAPPIARACAARRPPAAPAPSRAGPSRAGPRRVSPLSPLGAPGCARDPPWTSASMTRAPTTLRMASRSPVKARKSSSRSMSCSGRRTWTGAPVTIVPGTTTEQVGAGATLLAEAADQPGSPMCPANVAHGMRGTSTRSTTSPIVHKLADEGVRHLHTLGGDVLAELPRGDRPPDVRRPPLLVLRGVGIDRLQPAAVVAGVTDLVADRAAAEAAALGARVAHLDAAHGPLVDGRHRHVGAPPRHSVPDVHRHDATADRALPGAVHRASLAADVG